MLNEIRIHIHKAHDEGLRKYEELMKLNGGPKDKAEKEILDHVQKERATRKFLKYADGKSLKKTTKTKKKKVLKEDAPTNSMGSSSSTHGTGSVDTFDPTLRRNPRDFEQDFWRRQKHLRHQVKLKKFNQVPTPEKRGT